MDSTSLEYIVERLRELAARDQPTPGRQNMEEAADVIEALVADNETLALKLDQITEDRDRLHDERDSLVLRLDASESMLAIWRDAEAKRREGDHFEIRLDDHQQLDEIVGSGLIHLEQMDTNEWFLDLAGCALWIVGKKVELRPRDYNDWPEAQKASLVERRATNPVPVDVPCRVFYSEDHGSPCRTCGFTFQAHGSE